MSRGAAALRRCLPPRRIGGETPAERPRLGPHVATRRVVAAVAAEVAAAEAALAEVAAARLPAFLVAAMLLLMMTG